MAAAIMEWLIVGWLLILGIGFVWIVLLPLRIAARIAWPVLAAGWLVSRWIVRLAACYWRGRP